MSGLSGFGEFKDVDGRGAYSRSSCRGAYDFWRRNNHPLGLDPHETPIAERPPAPEDVRHCNEASMEKRPRPFLALALIVGLPICGTLAIYLTAGLFPTATPEQARHRQAAEQSENADRQRAGAERAAAIDRERSLCKQADVCRHYGEARQDCAAAGDIQACIDIKMKGDSTMYCAGDGAISYATPDMPNRLRCAVFELGL